MKTNANQFLTLQLNYVIDQLNSPPINEIFNEKEDQILNESNEEESGSTLFQKEDPEFQQIENDEYNGGQILMEEFILSAKDIRRENENQKESKINFKDDSSKIDNLIQLNKTPKTPYLELVLNKNEISEFQSRPNILRTPIEEAILKNRKIENEKEKEKLVTQSKINYKLSYNVKRNSSQSLNSNNQKLKNYQIKSNYKEAKLQKQYTKMQSTNYRKFSVKTKNNSCFQCNSESKIVV